MINSVYRLLCRIPSKENVSKTNASINFKKYQKIPKMDVNAIDGKNNQKLWKSML